MAQSRNKNNYMVTVAFEHQKTEWYKATETFDEAIEYIKKIHKDNSEKFLSSIDIDFLHRHDRED